jgi:uncharacterized lipoprotein YajG
MDAYKPTAAFLLLLSVFLTSGCATTGSSTEGKKLGLEADRKYMVENTIAVDKSEDEVDSAKLLTSALKETLKEKGLLTDLESKSDYYLISSSITEYDMGNAFKRWLMPGYGSTVLGVHTEISEPTTGETIETMDHRQTVAAGGLYTIGAHQTIFNTVANDIVNDIERRHTDGKKGFFIELDPWLKNEEKGPEEKTSVAIKVLPITDQRTNKHSIGEREAAFEVSMGSIYTNRDVADYMTEAVQNELLASGNSLTSDNPKVSLSGSVKKFWISTDTTALYWDIIGEIEVQLNASSATSQRQNVYSARSVKRTYIYPSQELVEVVISNTIRDLMIDIRKDKIWVESSASD